MCEEIKGKVLFQKKCKQSIVSNVRWFYLIAIVIALIVVIVRFTALRDSSVAQDIKGLHYLIGVFVFLFSNMFIIAMSSWFKGYDLQRAMFRVNRVQCYELRRDFIIKYSSLSALFVFVVRMIAKFLEWGERNLNVNFVFGFMLGAFFFYAFLFAIIGMVATFLNMGMLLVYLLVVNELMIYSFFIDQNSWFVFHNITWALPLCLGMLVVAVSLAVAMKKGVLKRDVRGGNVG